MPIVPTIGPASVNQSTSVQYVMDQCKLHTKLQNYFGVGQISGEPGCGIATRVNQMLMQRRMAWKFNRVALDSISGNFLVTQQGRQDILFGGASCFVLLNNQTGGGTLPFGGVGIDLAPSTYNGNPYGPVNGGTAGITISGSTITVQTLDPHPFQSGNIGQSVLFLSGCANPAFNSLFTWNQLTQTSAWTQGYVITAIPDNQHLQFAVTRGQVSGAITSISQVLTSSAAIVTLTVPNTMSAGDIMNVSGMTTNTLLNTGGVGNVPPIVLTGATPSTVTFNWTAPITAGAETGLLTATQSGAPGIFNLGWIESASVQDINSTAFPQPVKPIEAVHRVSVEYATTGDKLSIGAMVDYNNGVIRFRLSEPMGTYAFQFNLIYQARAPKLTTADAIFQWPDDLSYVLVEMALWQASRFAYGQNAEETQGFAQSAQAALMSALESEDKEANDQAITPEFSLMR